MSTIRRFIEGDIEQVAHLHKKVFPLDGDEVTPQWYETYFHDVFLSGPWPSADFHSLVCEESDGSISGFLGVIPLRMAYKGQPLWATLCTQFCVDPDRRGLTGPRLMRQHLSGPQDLTVADEANAATLPLWRWAGGESALASSLRFLRPLRPARLALQFAEQRPALSMAAHLASPGASLVDFALSHLPKSPVHPSPPPANGEPLDPSTMMTELDHVTRDRSIVPVYEPGALAWHLRRIDQVPGQGTLRRVLARHDNGSLLGWYVYYEQPGGTGEVIQVAGAPDTIGLVLDHLIYNAWQAGVAALAGRVDPAHAQAYSDRHCLMTRRGPWTLVHARNKELLLPFHRGDVFYSRLEGEWCTRFTAPMRTADTGRPNVTIASSGPR